ncbi:MAG TPA: hypothetical protein VMG30_11680 [Acidobacteriota bacterium]|nr:hypothetical protein [Acidobacteriota bacterium]
MNGKRLIFVLLLLAFGFAGGSGYAQRPAETVAAVPALDAFHEVIHKIWHEAWPQKDIAMLQKLVPDVEKGIASVAAAPLPGILRDKKEAWDEGVRKLQSAGADYKAAAAAKDDAKLLSAAEALHSRFEGLMRAVRPALKELDEFHAVLYMLYHQYLPANDMENIRKAAVELTQRMAVLNQVKLPERLIDKDHDFQVARGMLSQSVSALEGVIRSNDAQVVKDAVEAVHTRYQALEKIF